MFGIPCGIRVFFFDKIRLFITEMPEGIPGTAVEWKDEPGTYQVFIRKQGTDQEQEQAFIHEMLHIWHEDFHPHERDIVEMEMERKKAAQQYQKQAERMRTACHEHGWHPISMRDDWMTIYSVNP